MKFTPILGNDLSGSLEGITASRNKGGAYFRGRVSPIQPNTQAQIQAKIAFGASTSTFSTFTSSEKALWGQFAETIYTSRKAPNVGQFSGANAYVSLATAYNSSQRLLRTNTFLIDGVAPSGGISDLIYLQPYGTPPNLPSAPVWDDESGVGQALTIESGEVDSTGKVKIQLQIGSGTGTNMSNFLNPAGRNFSWAIFMSNGNVSDNMSYARPEQYLMGYALPTVCTDPNDLDSIDNLTIQFLDAFDTGKYQQYPLVGQYVVLTLYTVTQDMQMDRVGSIEVQMAFAL